ncbi:putative glycoside hydrolase [Bacillus sp. TS-2]|nr:putative glycoside hydrolase [Bacillus sp. TS-2]
MGYKNPVISMKGTDHGDPAVLKFNGFYYLYHTASKEIPVYRSTNLIHWEKVGVALQASTDPKHWAQIGLWAPEVIYENGTFYMYVTAALMNQDGTENDEVRRIGVAKSDSPTGPFQLNPEPLTNEWSIDAHPFKDDDGSYYMFYNVRNEYTRGPNGVIGTGNVVDRMKDLETLTGNPTMVVKPERLEEGNKDGSFYWNEGPFVLKHKGLYYQMYSAGFFGDETYGVYYATSEVPMGHDGMNDKSWVKWQNGTPILQTNEACLGPGHHVIVKGPNGIDDYMVYHGYEPEEKLGERRVRVGRLQWKDGHIDLEPPTKDTIPMPTMPDFDGRFIDSTVELNQQLNQFRLKSYFFESNLKKGSGHAFFIDEQNYVFWTLSQNRLEIILVENGQEKVKQVRSLSIDSNAFHLIQIEKKKEKLNVWLDRVLYSELLLEFPKKVGTVTIDAEILEGTILTQLD